MFNREARKARLAEIDVEFKRARSSPTLSAKQKCEIFDRLESELDALQGEFKAAAHADRQAATYMVEVTDADQQNYMNHLKDNRNGFPMTTYSSEDRRLSFKGVGTQLATKIVAGGDGMKAVAGSGAVVVDQGFEPNPVPLGRPATSLLNLLPTKAHDTEQYAWLQQSTRTNNAAVVAVGDVKPTSVYGVTRVESSLSTIAHLSEGISRYWILDNASLQSWLTTELVYGLEKAVENFVLAGINAASPATQAFSTSAVQTLRKALTKLEVNGHVASAIVLAPADWETVELSLSSTNAIEHLALPYDPAAKRLFGVPIAVAVGQQTGVAHVISEQSVFVDTDRRGISMQWSETSNADDFSRNLIRARVESRYGVSVTAPLGVVKAAVEAGS